MPKYFESIQHAAIEKVHSEFIAWLFSDKHSILSGTQKVELLNNLFDLNLNENRKIERIFTEYKSIDIVIKCSDLTIVIENKLKASQHSNQLNNYSILIDADDKIFNNKNTVKYFLSLIGELPISTSLDWKVITYYDLFKHLNTIVDKYKIKSEIILDYLDNLRMMIASAAKFIENPGAMPFVFEDGSKKKYEKKDDANWDEYKKYISVNGLETTFQKLYLTKVLTNNPQISKQFGLVFINETRGEALLDLKNPEGYLLHINDTTLGYGIQIQGLSIKLQIETPYNNDGTRENLTSTRINAIENIKKKIFDFASAKHPNLKQNNAKEPKDGDKLKKAYFSMSTSLFPSKEEFYKLSFVESSKIIITAIQDFQNLIKEIQGKFNEK